MNNLRSGAPSSPRRRMVNFTKIFIRELLMKASARCEIRRADFHARRGDTMTVISSDADASRAMTTISGATLIFTADGMPGNDQSEAILNTR